MSDTNETVVAAPEAVETEGTQDETIVLSKKDYESLNQTLGSLKRELKDLRKPKETAQQAEPAKQEEFGLLQKSYLRAAGITDAEEVELARTTAKKWGMEIDALVDDSDFQEKLEKFRTKKSNQAATSNIRGNSGTSQAKLDPAYWMAKGTPPTREEVPNRAERMAIVNAMMKNMGSGKTFYND